MSAGITDKVSTARIPTTTVEAPSIHIYPFSRLVGAPATKWERLMEQLEEKERIVYLYYQPAREAIIRLTERAGADRERIYLEMSERAARAVHSPSQNPVRDNQRCFERFEEVFLPKIKQFKASLLRVPQSEGTFFSGVILKGMPHMIILDKRGRERYVYLYPSNWKDHELDSYMELLTVIIESEFGADAADLWCMGLKTGTVIPRPRSKSRTRQACHDAARHFKRMIDAGIIQS